LGTRFKYVAVYRGINSLSLYSWRLFQAAHGDDVLKAPHFMFPTAELRRGMG